MQLSNAVIIFTSSVFPTSGGIPQTLTLPKLTQHTLIHASQTYSNPPLHEISLLMLMAGQQSHPSLLGSPAKTLHVRGAAPGPSHLNLEQAHLEQPRTSRHFNQMHWQEDLLQQQTLYWNPL